MFFPDRIKSIKKTDRVLEVGPGNTPFYRSNVLLEKTFEDDNEAFLQAGATQKKDLKKKTVHYKGESFPFTDKQFDYVICSHVLEHIPKKDIPFFISELCRTSFTGYIEVPLYTSELLNDLQYHLSLVYIDKKNIIHFLAKEDIDLNNIFYIQLKNLMTSFAFNDKIIPLNLDVFGNGFEFKGKIEYVIHESSESFFTFIENQSIVYKLRFNKDVSFYIKKLILQFNKNHFLSKLYSKLGVAL